MHVFGALLFVDVSGFTRLSSALAQTHGAAGAERLSMMLDGFFAALLAEVRAAGGAPVSFAGDGLLVCFPSDDAQVASAALAASRAALAMLDRVALLDPVEGIEMGLHAGIVTGELVYAALGGHRGHFAPVVLGAPVKRLGVIFPGTARGQAVISSEALAPISRLVETRPIDSERSLLLRVRSRETARTPPRGSDARLSTWLPEAVRARAGLPLGRWMAEMRSLTLLFVSLTDVDPVDIERADAAVRAVQEELEVHHGALHQVTLDEKGLAVTCAFGLGSPGGDRPAVSAVRCGLALADRLTAIGIAPRLGVATGRVFVGPIGDAGRRQLAIVGATMMRAARMAQREHGVILDEASREAAEGVIDLAPAPAHLVRGEPVPIWRALGARRRAPAPASDRVVGRVHALAVLEDALLRVDRAAASAVVSLDGPAGIGKSRLAAHVAEKARALGLAVLEIAGDLPSVDRPYHGLRSELERRLGIDEPMPHAARVEAALAAVSQLPGREGLGPLLAPVLGVPIADTPRTVGIAAQRRADVTAELVTALLAEGERRLVIVDDAQWLDAATANVVAQILGSPAPTLLVLCTRIPTDELIAPVARLLEHAERVSVGALEQSEVEALVAVRLGVSRAPPDLARWVATRAGGNPFFVREVAASLLASGLVEVRDGIVVRESSVEELDRAAPPPSVEAVVTRRIDALPAPAQLALKVASVLGMCFSLGALGALHPLGVDAAESALAILEQVGFVETTDAGRRGGSFEVAHRIVLEVAYGLLPGELRVHLHAGAASWLEGHGGVEAAELAWHWERTADRDRASHWLEIAWTEADGVGALAESHGLARRALALTADTNVLGRAAWLRRMSDASANQSAYTRAVEEAGDALGALGRRLPEVKSGWRRMLARGLLSQLAHRALPPGVWARGRPGDDEAALALARAGEGFYFVSGDQLVALACFLESVNSAERVGESMVGRVPNALGVVGTAVSAMGLPQIGAYYHQRALRTATAGGEHRFISPALFHIASCQAMRGEWVAADETCERCVEHCVAAGQRHSLLFVRAMQSINNLIRGDVARAEAMADELAEHASALRHERGTALAGSTRAMTALLRGDFERADALARDARTVLMGRNDLTWTLPSAIAGRAALARGRTDDAIVEARSVMRAFRGTRPADYRRLEGFAGPAETFVRIPGHPAREVDDALELLHSFARSQRVGWPRYHLLRGILLARRGQKVEAEALLAKAVEAAGERELAIEIARAKLALARLRSDGDAEASARRWMRAEGILPETLDIAS